MAHIRELQISTSLRIELMRNALPTSGIAEEPAVGMASMRYFRPALDTGTLAGYPRNMSGDAQQDVEPSVISMVKNDGSRIIVSVYTKFIRLDGYNDPGPRQRLYYVTTNDAGTILSSGILPGLSPGGYVLSYDPILAVNPYGDGLAPRTIYCVGIISTDSATTTTVGLWSTQDGQTWTGPTNIRTVSSPWATDKPFVHVSWYGLALGNVYVGWIEADLTQNANPNNNAAVFRRERQISGQGVWDAPFAIAYDNVQAPSVADDQNGVVSYSFVNFHYGDIRVTRSADFGGSFGSHNIIDSSGGILNASATIDGGIRGATVPVLRFNNAPGVNRMMVVWHALEGTHANVFYSFYPCASQCNTFSWEARKYVSDDPSMHTTDKFQPTVDCDTNGNVVVNFYDGRYNDPNSKYYDEELGFLSWSGAPIFGKPNVRVTPSSSNAGYYNNLSGNGDFLGDYHGIWTDSYATGDGAVTAFIGFNREMLNDQWDASFAPANVGDLWFGRYQF